MGTRAVAGVAAAAIGAAVLAAASVVLASPAWSISPPTDPDPAPGAAFAITSTVPSVIPSSPLSVSGIAGAGEAVTVEAVGAGNASCAAVADGTGAWSCDLPLTEQDSVTVQAYREGGAFLEDYDDRTAVTVFAPAFDAGPTLTWNASTFQQLRHRVREGTVEVRRGQAHRAGSRPHDRTWAGGVARVLGAARRPDGRLPPQPRA